MAKETEETQLFAIFAVIYAIICLGSALFSALCAKFAGNVSVFFVSRPCLKLTKVPRYKAKEIEETQFFDLFFINPCIYIKKVIIQRVK